jgi:predicted GNAT family acetyltransferase
MELRRHADAAAFLTAAGDYLEAREAEHNLMLGLCARLLAAGRLFGHDPYLATVHDGETPVAAALRTPPYHLVVSQVAELAAVDLLADDLASVALAGVLGPKEASRRFAERWARANGRWAKLGTEQRIFRAESVDLPAAVPGRMRIATAEDRPLLVDWFDAFLAEAAPGRPGPPVADQIDERLHGAGGVRIVIWEDEARPVSLAGSAGPTRNGIRVGPVYTPPDLRGRGYASAVTAALTQQLLAEGRRFCSLFTDLANPISNRIYERIGYRPVTDVDEYRFLD